MVGACVVFACMCVCVCNEPTNSLFLDATRPNSDSVNSRQYKHITLSKICFDKIHIFIPYRPKFLYRLPEENFVGTLIPHIRATCLSHLRSLDIIILTSDSAKTARNFSL